MMSIIPGIGSLMSISPQVDDYEISQKGLKVIDYLNNHFSDFNILFTDISKQSLKDFFYHQEIEMTIQARKAVYYGDLDHLMRLEYQDLDIN